MCCMSVHTSTTTAQDNPEQVRESGSRTKEREKEKREGDQAVVKLRVECLPSSRDTISLGGRHSDMKN